MDDGVVGHMLDHVGSSKGHVEKEVGRKEEPVLGLLVEEKDVLVVLSHMIGVSNVVLVSQQ